MKSDLSSGLGQADLTLKYEHHKGGIKGGFRLKDLQVSSAEFIGTFFLAFIVAMTKTSAAQDTPESAPLAIGFALCAIVYMTGPTSGGMVNPAVTLGLVVRSKLNLFEAAYCVLSQLLGALTAGGIAYAIYSDSWDSIGFPSVSDSDRRGQAFVGEMIQTFALVSTVLNTATTTTQANNSYFGVAIGFVVLSGALVIGGVTGACFNPAVGALAILQADWNDAWVFLVAPLVGAIIAGLVFRITNPSEWDSSDPLARLSASFRNPNGNRTRMASMLTTEFIGTFFWAWILALSGNASSVMGGMIAVGTMVCSMTYMGGAVSGAHYNPAVTLAVYIRGRKESPQLMRFTDCCLYVGVQVLGAFVGGSCAAFVNKGLVFDILSPSINTKDHTLFAGVVIEMIFTFGLVLLVLSVGTNEKVGGNSYFGLAVGFYLIAAQVGGTDISGSVLNPAIGELLIFFLLCFMLLFDHLFYFSFQLWPCRCCLNRT